MDNTTAAQPAEKKKPGRPKKKVMTAPIEVHGIIDKPANTEDVMELVYCNPSLFKKLLQLYKQFDVSEVEMSFTKEGIDIFCTDHLKKSNIYTFIDGKCMNLYYCKEPVHICVTQENLDSILGTLGKNHYKITFLLKENNFRTTMYIVVKDIEYNNDDSYDVDIVYKPEAQQQARPLDNDINYPIKFKVSAKHFKTRINTIKKSSPNFIIQKAGDGPIQFTFDKAQKVGFTGVYNDSDKIDLKSTISQDDIFSVSVNIGYIKPFSNSNIGEEVYIAADTNEKISFMTYLDKKDIGYACRIKIFTEITDYRGRA
jgi:hypothetical protein